MIIRTNTCIRCNDSTVDVLKADIYVDIVNTL